MIRLKIKVLLHIVLMHVYQRVLYYFTIDNSAIDHLHTRRPYLYCIILRSMVEIIRSIVESIRSQICGQNMHKSKQYSFIHIFTKVFLTVNFCLKTVYFSPCTINFTSKTIYFWPGPWIFIAGPFDLSQELVVLTQDLYLHWDHILSRAKYLTLQDRNSFHEKYQKWK